MLLPETTGHIVALATAAGVLTQAIGPLFRYFAGNRLANRRATLQEVAQRQTDLDGGYTRLERENQRLSREVVDLRTALRLEEDAHQRTREDLERIQERCDDCERFMRMMGRREDFPPKPPT